MLPNLVGLSIFVFTEKHLVLHICNIIIALYWDETSSQEMCYCIPQNKLKNKIYCILSMGNQSLK